MQIVMVAAAVTASTAVGLIVAAAVLHLSLRAIARAVATVDRS